ncbi:MAG: response regulator [Desulfobacteraceae bacterium]|nr:response regulator [Desulfobacteraceae bacterium]
MPQRVLIVDDEPNIVLALQFLMEQNGYQVDIASSGEAAIESVMRTVPDLILLDIMLPGIDGYEVCEIVRLNPQCRKTKIVFLTAKGCDVDVAKGMLLGADAYIIKPFANADVVQKVRQLLGES